MSVSLTERRSSERRGHTPSVDGQSAGTVDTHIAQATQPAKADIGSQLGGGTLATSVLISYLVVSPAAVAMWRGWWYLADLYLLPGHAVASYTASLGISLAWALLYLLARGAGLLRRAEHRCSSAWAAGVAERGFTLLSALAGVWFWRGVWGLLDVYSRSEQSTWLCALAAPAVLLATNSLRTAWFAPMSFVRDGGPGAWDLLGDAAQSLPLICCGSCSR